MPAGDITPLEDRELRAWRGMLKVHRDLSVALDDELQARHGLQLSSYEVLMFLADAQGGKLRMSEIAERVLLSRSGLTRLVDRLVRAGLLERSACVDDGRGAFAQLTPAGREKLDAVRRTHLDGVRRLFLERVTPAEQELLGEVWARVSA
jgi:DNA-binding MarR family transcriptional regulator